MGANPRSTDLKSLRAWIDRLDRRLVRLLSLRARAVRGVGEWKKLHGTAVHDPKREAEVIQKVLACNSGPLPDTVLADMFRGLVSAFRNWEAGESAKAPSGPSPLDGKSFGIFGLGLIGASVALALRARFPQSRIIGCDPDATTGAALGEALSQFESAPSKLFEADVLLLCAPVGAITDFLRASGSGVRGGVLVMDTASTKTAVFEAASSYLNRRACFIGGHPLAGKAVAGAQAADSALFIGKHFVLTPPRPVPAIEMELARAVVRSLGGHPIEMSADTHDEVLAVTSHLPQLLSTSLALLGRESLEQHGDAFVFGPAFRDMTRLATSDFVMWRDISKTNSRAIGHAMDRYIEILRSIREKLAQGEFAAEFERAKKFKESKAA